LPNFLPSPKKRYESIKEYTNQQQTISEMKIFDQSSSSSSPSGQENSRAGKELNESARDGQMGGNTTGFRIGMLRSMNFFGDL
jgi:hypothetical protein